MTSRYDGHTDKDLAALSQYITIALATLVAIPQTVSLVPVVDLFALEELLQPSYGKRPHTYDDPDALRLHAGITE